MSLNDNAIVTLQEMKAFLEESGTGHDSQLETLINGISDLFETEFSRSLKEATYTDKYLNGSGLRHLLIPNYPVISISVITEDGQSLTENEDFFVDYDWGILWKPKGKIWEDEKRNVKLTYKAGWGDVAKMAFDSGSEEPLIGATLTSASGSGDVIAIKVTSGTWAGDDAVGYVEFESITGEFKDNETVDISGGSSNVMTVNEPVGSATTIAGIPNDLKLVFMKWVGWEFQQADEKRWGETSRSYPEAGTVSTFRESEVWKDVQRVIDKYQRCIL